MCQEDIVNVLRTIKAEDNTAGVAHWNVLLLHKAWYHVTLQEEPAVPNKRREEAERLQLSLHAVTLVFCDCSVAQAHVFWLAQRGVYLLSLSIYHLSRPLSLILSLPFRSLAPFSPLSFFPSLLENPLCITGVRWGLWWKGHSPAAAKYHFLPIGGRMTDRDHRNQRSGFKISGLYRCKTFIPEDCIIYKAFPGFAFFLLVKMTHNLGQRGNLTSMVVVWWFSVVFWEKNVWRGFESVLRHGTFLGWVIISGWWRFSENHHALKIYVFKPLQSSSNLCLMNDFGAAKVHMFKKTFETLRLIIQWRGRSDLRWWTAERRGRNRGKDWDRDWRIQNTN